MTDVEMDDMDLLVYGIIHLHCRLWNLEQGSQTRDPRTIFGPRGHFVRHEKLFGNFQIINI